MGAIRRVGPRRIGPLQYVWAFLLAMPVFSYAEQCDCQRVIGRCTGAVEFVRGYGAKPSFGAELIIHSSERQCSKVEYVVGSTPYQTVLVNKTAEGESVFGTSKITEGDVSYRACYVCESTASSKGASLDDTAKRFNGVWSGEGRNSFFLSASRELRIEQNDSKSASVVLIVAGDEHGPIAGTIVGNTLTFVSGTTKCRATLSGENTLIYEAGGLFGTARATLTRQ